MIEEKLLVKRIIQGDQDSFRILVDQYKGLVTHIVYTSIKNKKDQEDLSQEIFLKIYLNLATFKFKSKLSTWIGRIAYHCCINSNIRKNVLDHTVLENDKENQLLESIESDQPEPDEIYFNHELNYFLKQVIEELPLTYQTVILLYHKDELTYKEISIIMNLTESNVKVLLFRARKSLKEKMLNRYKKEELCP